MQPRLVEPFELFEEDFLPGRPARLQLVGQFVEIDPPGWALKCITKIGGKRHPKREKASSAYSPLALAPFRPPGQPSAEDTDAYNRAIARRRGKQAAKGQQSPEAPIPAGNLIEDDYRFWKGFALETSERNHGQCRWCGTSCVGRDMMLCHHTKGYCKDFLLALYRYAFKQSKQRYCFSCKHETQERKWGVVLCKNRSCHARWKFNFSEKLPGFVQYRQWAEDLQKVDPVNGPFKDLPDPDEDDVVGTPC